MSSDFETGEEPGPPPAPSERGTTPVSAPSSATTVGPGSPPGRPSRPRPVRAVIISGLVGLVAGFVLAEALGGTDLPWRDAAAGVSERDARFVDLLEGIVASEGIMLTFNDDVAEELQEATDEAAALAAIADAAEVGAEGLRAARPALLEPVGDRMVDDVRDVYIPHLDSWIEYLAALAERPELLFLRDDQQPYLLRINSTAEAFADSLEALLATDPAPRVADLAEGILDDGFRSERDADI